MVTSIPKVTKLLLFVICNNYENKWYFELILLKCNFFFAFSIPSSPHGLFKLCPPVLQVWISGISGEWWGWQGVCWSHEQDHTHWGSWKSAQQAWRIHVQSGELSILNVLFNFCMFFALAINLPNFFIVGPPKESIFLTTICGLYFGHHYTLDLQIIFLNVISLWAYIVPLIWLVCLSLCFNYFYIFDMFIFLKIDVM